MFSPINYNQEFDKMKKIYIDKDTKSVDKMISSKKINLSKMDEKLSLLNSDIEDLYKKYAETKKIRQKKEKSEQNLASRINFLIDEERKIRTKIENKPTKKEEKNIKMKSLQIFNTPETITNTGTIRNTIESNDSSERNRFRYINKKNEKIFEKNNRLKIKSSDEKERKNNTLSSHNSSAGNNTNENMSNNNTIKENIRINNNKNINIPSSSNVTNNVCIIINNNEQNTSVHNNNSNDYFNGDISFAKKENNNTNNTSDINMSTTEKEKRKINIEIQNIKLKLASKIKSLDKDRESNSENNEDNKNISINTPSLSRNSKKYKGNKNGIRSLKNILNMKRKYLKNLNKEIDLKRINNNIKRRSVENKKRNNPFSANMISDIYNDKNSPNKSNKEKSINKRSYSKPDNIYKQSNKIHIINNPLHKNKSELSNKITLSSHNKKLSIDSNEVILYDSDINNFQNNNYITEIKPEKNIDKNNFNYKSPSSKSSIPLSSLTFQQSIENKRKMLGLGLNLKLNEGNKEHNNIKVKNIYKNNDINKLKIKYKEKISEKNKLNNKEEEKSKIDYNNEDGNSYDVLSYPSISVVTNPLDSNVAKSYNFRNNFSLMSIFSDKSNKTNIPRKILIKKKKSDNNNNDNNDAKIIKIKNITNNDIIIKKQEKNKNFVNSIRIIKKREKNNNIIENNNLINNINNININNNPINTIDKKEAKKELREKKPKLYENEITITKELAAIRRLNMKIREYKNSKPQISKISERRKNRFLEEKNINNNNDNDKDRNKFINKIEENSFKNNDNKSKSSSKNKKYRFKSYIRLSEIQSKANDSSSKKNSVNKNKKIRSNSNKSMNRLHNNIRLLKFS